MTPEAKLVIQKIDELGSEAAAEFFGKTVNQVKTMKRTGNVTLEAYSRLAQLLNQDPSNKDQVQPTVTSATYTSSNDFEAILQDIGDHERRIQQLELARVVPAQPSYVRPQGEIVNPPRPLNAPPIVHGLGAIDGIAPSAADANNQGEKGGMPAQPAKHMGDMPPGIGNRDWNRPFKPRR